MKVSVITPSYNQAQFLELTIRSVFGQNYPDLEYLIVDGASTDGSQEVIQEYEDQISWWVSEPDSGQAEAINKGFRKATGDVIAWLNSDDVYAPGAVAAAVKVFSENPELGLVYGDAVSFDQDGLPLNDLIFGDWGLQGLAAFNIICQPAVFMRRSALESAGFLDETYHMLLDHHLWLRIARASKIRHIPEVWAFARHHPAAKNVAQAPKFGEEAYRLLAWMETQPDFSEIIMENRHGVLAMAHRFNGRYLLDGGQGWAALKSYTHSMVEDPKVALGEWRRIIFAVLSILGLGKLGDLYYQARKISLPDSVKAMGIQNVHHLY